MKLNDRYFRRTVSQAELDSIEKEIAAAHGLLCSRTGKGNDFLGWIDLPTQYDREELARIKQAAKRIQETAEILIVIGIGGSYLGARAGIELLHSPSYNVLPRKTPAIYYAGNTLSPSALQELLTLCEEKSFAVNIISKSGTTTEPALAFRVFRDLLVRRYGREEAAKRIYATTDRARGSLKALCDQEGYETFVIPDDVGGRFSVLTAVGLLPFAVSGIDVEEMLAGAAAAADSYNVPLLEKNDCYRYAACRNLLYRQGKAVELMVSYDPSFVMMAEWWKQLFGESEGKEHKGLFPASVNFSTDLHSLGQFVQEGSPILFETVVDIAEPKQDFVIPFEESNGDGLNFLAGKTQSFVNRKAMEGTLLAHTEGGVPNLLLTLEKVTPWHFGEMVYFFEKACAISGYVLGVNPFDQPGVESYKNNMYALLGKPGYEERRAMLEAALSR